MDDPRCWDHDYGDTYQELVNMRIPSYTLIRGCHVRRFDKDTWQVDDGDKTTTAGACELILEPPEELLF